MNSALEQNYEIKSLIGQGGMSKVYLAEHKRLRTQWAVKEVAKQQGVRFDFLAELNILKQLQHPMLPRIVNIFEDASHIYIVEDFVEGMTLEALLKEQDKVDEQQGLIWFQDLCQTLKYLHDRERPIIYRDMKPSNVMLQPDGTLKLIDFGIAREYKQESDADTTYIGTKGYAAPEQFGKAQTDARTDIYSLGVTMYHLHTGKSPYEPPYQFVPVRELNRILSPGIEYILNKCVQPEPENRYQSVDELLEDLRHIYRFDRTYRRFVRNKRLRVAIISVMFVASIGLMGTGYMVMGQEKETDYSELLQTASALYVSDLDGSLSALAQAHELFPDRAEPQVQQAYALYLSDQNQECIDHATRTLRSFPDESDLHLIMASAYFELADYENAADNFANGASGKDMNADYLRDYAVSLGRLGHIDDASDVMEQLESLGAYPDTTLYVRGEIAYAKGEYNGAEEAFLSALAETKDDLLIRRCYISLAETYRDGANNISDSYSKAIMLIEEGLTLPQLAGNTVLYEMLGSAYYNRATLESGGNSDLIAAAENFEKAINAGVQKLYLYQNVFTAYQAAGGLEQASAILKAMKEAYPSDYLPYALSATLMIMQENQKPESIRNYSPAYAEYENALERVGSSDETTQLQQLEGLIKQLEDGGWLNGRRS